MRMNCLRLVLGEKQNKGFIEDSADKIKEISMPKKKEMTINDLKKHLTEFNETELKKLLCHLYKNSDLAEKMINVFILGSVYEEKLLEQYKEKMYGVFFPDNIVRSGFSLSWAKSLISEFKKIVTSNEKILDLQLYYVECGTDFTNTFGDIDMKFYDSMCSVYHTVVQAVNKHENDDLYLKFKDRLYSIVYDTRNMGWGFHDYVSEVFNCIPWRAE